MSHRVHFIDEGENANDLKKNNKSLLIVPPSHEDCDNTNDDKKTPERDASRLQQEILPPPPPIRRVALPIVRSKIGPVEAGMLLEETQNKNIPKVTNGHSNNLRPPETAEDISKIPKALQNLVSRHKIQPKVNQDRKRDLYRSPPAARVNGAEWVKTNNNTNFKTVLSKRVEMKRVDAKKPAVPSSQTKITTNKQGYSINNNEQKSSGSGLKQGSLAHPDLSGSKNLKRKTVIADTLSQPTLKSKSKGMSVSQISTATPSSRFGGTTIKSPQHHANISTIVPTVSTGMTGSGEDSSVPLPPVESFKTLKEFLSLPPAELSKDDEGKKDKGSNNAASTEHVPPQPPSSKSSGTPYFKSHFWEFVDPNKKEASPSKPPDKPKTYDATAVKSFIEKKKEARREKEIAEMKAKKEQLAKKKKQLAQLNEKCKNLVASSKPPIQPCSKKTGGETYTFIRQEVLENVLKNVVGDKEGADVHQPKKKLHQISPSAAISRSTFLLQEFESIVKRECINFLQPKPPTPPSQLPIPLPKARFTDKCVETTDSLADVDKYQSPSTASSIISGKMNEYTLQDYNFAAAKIQAAFKSFKVRKILGEANILPRDLVRMKQKLHTLRPSTSFTTRAPEKPYDTSLTAYLKLKLAKEVYVPPPTPPRPPTRKSFNEPYPKEALQRLQEATPTASVSRRNSLSDLRKNNMLPDIGKPPRPSTLLDTSALLETSALTPKGSASALNPRRRSESLAFGLAGVQPAPSISTVLFEKLRALQQSDTNTVVPTATSVSATSLIHASTPRKGDTKLERDFDSISSITRGSQSQDISITDDYFGPSDSELRRTRTSTPINQIPLPPPSKSAQVPLSPSLSGDEESVTTTIETDAELVSGAGGGRTGPVTATTSSDGVPMPALTLQYHAERERLNILEKALQATNLYERRTRDHSVPPNVPPPPQKIPTTSEIEHIAKTIAEDRIKVNLAELEKEKWSTLIKQQQQQEGTSNSLALEMMKCHQEAAKATAEVSKWMAEMGKSLLEDRAQTRIAMTQQQYIAPPPARVMDDPVNLAAIVYAAVDEAQRIAADKILKHREALKRVTRRPHQQQEEEQEILPTGNDVALQFPSSSYNNSLSENVSRASLLSLESNQVDDTEDKDKIFTVPISVQEEQMPSLGQHVNVHVNQEDVESIQASKVKEEDSFPNQNITDDSIPIEDEVSFLSEAKEITEVEVVTEEEGSILLQDHTTDNKTESPILSYIETRQTNSISEVEVEIGTTNLSQSFISEVSDHEYSETSFLSNKEGERPLLYSEPALISPEKRSDLNGNEEVSQQVSDSIHDPIIIDTCLTKEEDEPISTVGEIPEPFFTTPESPPLVEVEAPPSVETFPTHKDDKIEPVTVVQEQKGVDDEIREIPAEISTSLSDVIDDYVSVLEGDSGDSLLLQSPPQNFTPLETVVPSILDEHRVDNNDCIVSEQVSLSFISTDEDKERVDDVDRVVCATVIPEKSLGQEEDDHGEENKEEESAPSLDSNQVVEYSETSFLSDKEDEKSLLESEPGLISPEKRSDLNGNEEESQVSDSIHDSIVVDTCSTKEDEEQISPIIGEIQEPTSFTSPESPPHGETVPHEDKTELLTLVQEQQRVEDEIRELQSQISTSPSDVIDDYLAALEQGGDNLLPRPPPPYFTPLETVLSSISTILDEHPIDDDEFIHRVVSEEVSLIWEEWTHTRKVLSLAFTSTDEDGDKVDVDIDSDLVAIPLEQAQDQDDDKGEEDKEEEIGPCLDSENTAKLVSYLSTNKSASLTQLVRECISSALHIPELTTPSGYVDTWRKGAYTLEAMEHNLPKSKDDLISKVEGLISQLLVAPPPDENNPENSEYNVNNYPNPSQAWTCRPRDVVENFLVNDITRDEPNWVNIWPEAILLQDELADNIVSHCLKEVLDNFEFAYKNC